MDGTVLYTDSTHLKANANKKRYDKEVVAKSRSDYWDALDEAIEDDRAAHGKKPLKPKPREPVEKETKVSRTDPDSGYMVREGKPKGFFYLDHRTVDGRLGIITDTHATPASIHDSIPYLDRQRERFGLDVRAVGLDAGYATAGIAKGLEDRTITGVTGYRRPTPPKPGMLPKKVFTYDGRGRWLPLPGRPTSGLRNHGSERISALHQRSRQMPELPLAGVLHQQCQGPKNNHPSRLAGRQGPNRRQSPDGMGQADLQAPEGDRGTLLRRRQATSRASICPLQGPDRGEMSVPPCRRRPEHQENRPGDDLLPPSKVRLKGRGSSFPFHISPPSRPPHQKKTPPKFRRGLSAI